MKDIYFVKSFENDFILKTLRGKKKISFQSIDEIIKTKTIRTNTKSFGRNQRLACSFLHKNYLKTYRSQGLIFKTKIRPDFIYPFDLVLLTNAKKIIVHYYRIKDNLHIYYNHLLLPGFDKFVFKEIKNLLKKFPTPKKIWDDVNKFRVNAGYDPLPKQKHKLIEYNEVIFYKNVKIEPIAIYGYKKIARDVSKKYNLPFFSSAKKFWESLK